MLASATLTCIWSLPMRERGLKLNVSFGHLNLHLVAPHAGAWIEMRIPVYLLILRCVAPHAGAWIEISIDTAFSNSEIVAPHAGAWIEIVLAVCACFKAVSSLPMRERGLKCECAGRPPVPSSSLPMRERGLKSTYAEISTASGLVAPHAGAWIEIST